MAESSNYTRSVLSGSDTDNSRSVLGGSDVKYRRSVMGGSGEEYGGSDVEYSRTIVNSSDEVMEHPCEPCQNEGNNTTAVKYCTDCSEYQCGSCSKHHMKFKAFRHHVVKDVEAVKPVTYKDNIMMSLNNSWSDVDYSRTIMSGSDYVNENPCEPCQKEENNTTAVKYCTNCLEYQCGPCSKHHINLKAFRHHVVKDVEAVKSVNNEDSTKMNDQSTAKLAKLNKNSEQVQLRPGQVVSSSGTIRNVTAYLVSTIDVSTRNNKMRSNIYDLTVVQTHYCVVTDTENKSVKVVDIRTRCLTSEIQLDAELYSELYGWSITSVNDDQVAVTVNIKGVRKFLFFTTKGVCKILLFSVSASGIISDTHKSFNVESAYSGITYSNHLFYATAFRGIDVISMDGQIITTFTNKSFSGLYGIALSNDHNTLYVCSICNDTVFSVDLNGNVTASYKDDDLKSPSGITVDSDGYIYVCSMGTNCVHQLTADLNKVQVIIENSYVPRCTFKKNDNSVIVGFGNKIYVYNLTYY